MTLEMTWKHNKTKQTASTIFDFEKWTHPWQKTTFTTGWYIHNDRFRRVALENPELEMMANLPIYAL